MVMQGETVNTGAPLPFEGAVPLICQSAAGFYIGYLDRDGSPYSRESLHYYASALEAEVALEDGWTPR
jgi:hypothetical protein